MWIRFAAVILILAILGLAIWQFVPWGTVQYWAANEQRTFQNYMASALRGIQAGDPLAVWTLCTATAAYGFFHALGPGHGKVLIGGAALASSATWRRLGALTLLSSLGQSLTAIILVGSLVFILQMRSAGLVAITEDWLAPASYLAFAAIGLVLIFRGVKAWLKLVKAEHAKQSCCGHAHGPSLDEVNTLSSFRDAAALVLGIALRPCTGALFVLVLAARFDAFLVGCLAVITMGLGTAAFNLTVVGSSMVARKLANFGAKSEQSIKTVSATLHVAGGALIFLLSLSMVLPYIR